MVRSVQSIQACRPCLLAEWKGQGLLGEDHKLKVNPRRKGVSHASATLLVAALPDCFHVFLYKGGFLRPAHSTDSGRLSTPIKRSPDTIYPLTIIIERYLHFVLEQAHPSQHLQPACSPTLLMAETPKNPSNWNPEYIARRP